jgi:type VI secretion system protein ImpK
VAVGDAATGPRLVDLASDWLSTILALSQVPELPDPHALRARALELKSRFEREGAEHGKTGADVADAEFAMVAFLDATILNSRGAARDAWINQPMQLELYGHQNAGEEFFQRLEALRQAREERIEALEVYACCLAFGYAGRYLMFPEKLPALLEGVFQDVDAVRGGGQLPLAPNAGRRNERAAEERRGMPWWMPAAGFVAAIALTWLLLWVIGSLGAAGARNEIQRLVSR